MIGKRDNAPCGEREVASRLKKTPQQEREREKEGESETKVRMDGIDDQR